VTDPRDDRRRSPVQQVVRGLGQLLWCLIPALSLGVLMWLPAVQAWWKARTTGWAITAALLAMGGVVVVLGIGDVIDNSGILGLAYIGGALAGTVAAISGRRLVFADEVGRRIDPDVAQVLDRRERRVEARGIAAADPAMALELGIGRPELSRTYDDGGVVDLNNAGADAIAAVLGWSLGKAKDFVAERDQRLGYESVTELAAMSSISPRVLDRASDRIVLLPYVRTPD
jgi:hypothetical protein